MGLEVDLGQDPAQQGGLEEAGVGVGRGTRRALCGRDLDERAG